MSQAQPWHSVRNDNSMHQRTACLIGSGNRAEGWALALPESRSCWAQGGGAGAPAGPERRGLPCPCRKHLLWLEAQASLCFASSRAVKAVMPHPASVVIDSCARHRSRDRWSEVECAGQWEVRRAGGAWRLPVHESGVGLGHAVGTVGREHASGQWGLILNAAPTHRLWLLRAGDGQVPVYHAVCAS